MNVIGYVQRSDVADNTIVITFNNLQKQSYAFNNYIFSVLDQGCSYPVYFVGFSANHFIMVYQRLDMSDPAYITTDEFKDEFMKKFIELLVN
jgi:ssDNA-specific exonuclease RecJ